MWHRILGDHGGGTRRAMSRFVIHGYRRSLLVEEVFGVQCAATTLLALLYVGRYCRELGARRRLPQSQVAAWLYVTINAHSVTFLTISSLYPLKEKSPGSTGNREFEIVLTSEISRRAESNSVKIVALVGNIVRNIHVGFRAANPQIRSSGDNSR